ncbi:uncharacterized protein LOC141691176 [Apium graveolens]|uniref:uncharacterized protein LOC141691176 n=1 Tax=Apium graveolens TaxID=4045 RepID=UPI003D7912A7
MRQEIYWPTLRKDCESYVRKCQACQRHGNVSHRPQQSSTRSSLLALSINGESISWDLSRSLEDNVNTSWLQSTTRRNGSRILVLDNGTQFVGAHFEKALSDLKIQDVKASVAYPQANGLAEVMNRTILQGLKKMIEEIPRCWVDELPNVLWSYRTTPRSATGETPFRLAYGVDAVLPVEISLISPRIEVFDSSLAVKGLRFHNDLLEETREESRLRMIAQQEKTTRYFNKKVKNRRFEVGDLVLRDSATSQPTIS